MLPDRVSNPGPLTYESGALPIALRGLAMYVCMYVCIFFRHVSCFQRETIFVILYNAALSEMERILS